MGNKMIEVITSFNQHYYDLIGKDCVSSWLEHWPKDMNLTCYVEEFQLPEHPRVKQIDFSNLEQSYRDLQNEDFHSSVKKFSKKAFPFIHAMYNSSADWVLWIDADVLTENPVPDDFWVKQLNSRYLSAYMGVVYYADKEGAPGNWLVPETGMFAVNLKHPEFEKFRNEYARRYRERDFANLRREYDNDVLGAAINHTPAEYLDWSANLAKAYKTPMRHTVLGSHFMHWKAKHSKHTYSQLAKDQ
jgi:hypothetical protein